MRKQLHDTRFRVATGAALLAAVFAGCSKPATPAPAVPAPTVAPAAAMPAQSVNDTPVAASTPKSRAAAEPEVTTMTLAAAPSKLSVPVDLRYSFDGDASTGQPVTLHLAAVPRVAGSNLKVSIKDVPGIQKTAAALGVEKASASTAYRQQFVVTKLAGGPSELRVLVTMDAEIGSVFGWFSVPFNAAPAVTKQGQNKLK